MGRITRTNFGLHVRKILTNAQLLANAVSVQIAAGIAGKILFPQSGFLFLDWVADYGAIDPTCQVQVNTGAGGFPFLAPVDEGADGDVTGLLANGMNALSVLVPTLQVKVTAAPSTPTDSSLSLFTDPAALVGAGLFFEIFNGGNPLTGGDPGNRLIVDVFYSVIALP